jgi:hypothetical protein
MVFGEPLRSGDAAAGSGVAALRQTVSRITRDKVL